MRFFKSFLRLLLVSAIYWVIVFLFLIAIRYSGLKEELAFYIEEEFYLPVQTYYINTIITGLVISVFYALIETILDRWSRRLVVVFTILIKLFIYFILIVAALTYSVYLLELELDRDLPNEKGWWHKDLFFWTTVAYFLFASIIFSLIRVANDRFGRGNFLKILSGTYKRPKEEELVLMFLDLKDSTKIAEKLGHRLYSSFIQDCFKDLNTLLPKFDAEVYQYVGDEAVISWSIKDGFKNNNCLNLFYGFQKRLSKKQKYYQSNYGFQPMFKAGIHFGKVIVAEVGTIKKDLAFHGDVINTASRIQGLCNAFNASVLVSEPVMDRLSISKTHYNIISEAIELRGKEERLKIYAINYIQ